MAAAAAAELGGCGCDAGDCAGADGLEACWVGPTPLAGEAMGGEGDDDDEEREEREERERKLLSTTDGDAGGQAGEQASD